MTRKYSDLVETPEVSVKGLTYPKSLINEKDVSCF